VPVPSGDGGHVADEEPALGDQSRWGEDFSPAALALGIGPVLVPLAALGAVLLFADAVIMRLRRGERATIMVDLVRLAMGAFVGGTASDPGPSPADR
jgi:hypothetical protein